jgi:hypothetical protein
MNDGSTGRSSIEFMPFNPTTIAACRENGKLKKEGGDHGVTGV